MKLNGLMQKNVDNGIMYIRLSGPLCSGSSNSGKLITHGCLFHD